MLGFMSFCVQMHPGAAAFNRGYLWGYFILRWGYFPKTEVLDEMALTDTEIKKAKAKEKAYSLNDSRGLYLWITPAGGKLWRWAYTVRLNPQAVRLVDAAQQLFALRKKLRSLNKTSQ